VKSLTLKETQSPYTLTIDETTLVDGPVRVLQGERTIGVLVPPDEYEAFRTWKESQKRQAQIQQTHEAFEREVAAFERMLPELLQKYRDQVVAVHNGQVVEVGDSKEKVSAKVHQRLGDVIVYVQRVSEHPRIRKFPYFKVVR
jgi:imidazolonepropionase-like amidohydrolase